MLSREISLKRAKVSVYAFGFSACAFVFNAAVSPSVAVRLVCGGVGILHGAYVGRALFEIGQRTEASPAPSPRRSKRWPGVVTVNKRSKA